MAVEQIHPRGWKAVAGMAGLGPTRRPKPGTPRSAARRRASSHIASGRCSAELGPASASGTVVRGLKRSRAGPCRPGEALLPPGHLTRGRLQRLRRRGAGGAAPRFPLDKPPLRRARSSSAPSTWSRKDARTWCSSNWPVGRPPAGTELRTGGSGRGHASNGSTRRSACSSAWRPRRRRSTGEHAVVGAPRVSGDGGRQQARLRPGRRRALAHGYEAFTFQDLVEPSPGVETVRPDIIVLTDPSMPGMDGSEGTTGRVKKPPGSGAGHHLTANDAAGQRVGGPRFNADDYVVTRAVSMDECRRASKASCGAPRPERAAAVRLPHVRTRWVARSPWRQRRGGAHR